jgi:hypothetical protein
MTSRATALSENDNFMRDYLVRSIPFVLSIQCVFDLKMMCEEVFQLPIIEIVIIIIYNNSTTRLLLTTTTSYVRRNI